MHARLFCKTGTLAGMDVDLRPDNAIGRGERNDVALHERAVSSRHARLWLDRERGAYVLEDLGSRNGTAVDGVPVVEPVYLGPLHVITFAGTLDFIFQTLPGDGRPARTAPDVRHAPGTPDVHHESGTPDVHPETPAVDVRQASPPPDVRPEPSAPDVRPEPGRPDVRPRREETVVNADFGQMPDFASPDAPPEPPARTSEPEGQEELNEEGTRFDLSFGALPDLEDPSAAPAPREARPPQPVQFALEVGAGGDTRETFRLVPGVQAVGRGAACEIRFKQGTVSRRHATLTVDGPNVRLTDEGSTHGTFVNGERVVECELRPGDLIRFGRALEVVLNQL